MSEGQKTPYPFDSKPLNGLRGLAALHILVFHSLHYTTKEDISIYGQVRRYFKYLVNNVKFNNYCFFNRCKCLYFSYCPDFAWPLDTEKSPIIELLAAVDHVRVTVHARGTINLILKILKTTFLTPKNSYLAESPGFCQFITLLYFLPFHCYHLDMPIFLHRTIFMYLEEHLQPFS